MRTKLPPLICMICGFALLVQFFIPWDPIQRDMLEWVGNSVQVVAVFALAIGLASLIHMHGAKISRRAPGWWFSIVTLICMVIVAVVGVLPAQWRPAVASEPVAVVSDATGDTNKMVDIEHTLFGFQPAGAMSNAVVHGAYLPVEHRSIPFFNWIFTYVFFPLMATTFSLLAFYMMTATYRAVRVKSWESALLLAAAVIVLLGQVPVEQIPLVGPFISCGEIRGVPAFEYLKGLILQFPNTAAKRGIIIGIALGALATSVKIIFGIEKPYMGGRG